jgi:hypothetical protein
MRGVYAWKPVWFETLDPGVLPGPACLEQKPVVFAQEARHLRRRGTSLCLDARISRVMRRFSLGFDALDGKLVSDGSLSP